MSRNIPDPRTAKDLEWRMAVTGLLRGLAGFGGDGLAAVTERSLAKTLGQGLAQRSEAPTAGPHGPTSAPPHAGHIHVDTARGKVFMAVAQPTADAECKPCAYEQVYPPVKRPDKFDPDYNPFPPDPVNPEEQEEGGGYFIDGRCQLTVTVVTDIAWDGNDLKVYRSEVDLRSCQITILSPVILFSKAPC